MYKLNINNSILTWNDILKYKDFREEDWYRQDDGDYQITARHEPVKQTLFELGYKKLSDIVDDGEKKLFINLFRNNYAYPPEISLTSWNAKDKGLGFGRKVVIAILKLAKKHNVKYLNVFRPTEIAQSVLSHYVDTGLLSFTKHKYIYAINRYNLNESIRDLIEDLNNAYGNIPNKDLPHSNKSKHPTVIQYALAYMQKKMTPKKASELTVKNLSGVPNVFLGYGVPVINPDELESELWGNMTDWFFKILHNDKTDKDYDNALIGTLQTFRQNKQVGKELKKILVSKYGINKFGKDMDSILSSWRPM